MKSVKGQPLTCIAYHLEQSTENETTALKEPYLFCVILSDVCVWLTLYYGKEGCFAG